MSAPHRLEDEPEPLRPQRRSSRYDPHPDASTYIDSLVEQWRNRAPEMDGEVVRDPISPASAFRNCLDRSPAALVAVTNARSGFDRAVLGATAASIVNASTAPVLVAPVRDDTVRAAANSAEEKVAD